MKKPLLILLLGFFLAFYAKADTEPGNNTALGTPDNLAVGGSQVGSVGPGDVDDFYKLILAADGNLTISLSNNNNEYHYLYLFDSDGAQLLNSTSGSALSGIAMTTNGLAAGTYYVRVSGSSNLSNYNLSSSATTVPVTNDTEPNDNTAGALTFAENGTVTGHIGHRYNGGTYDQDDYYQVTTTADGNMNVALTNTNNQYTYIYFYDNDGTTLLGSTSGNAGAGINVGINGLAAGSYYVRVYAGSAYTGYTLTNTLTAVGVTNDPEANNTPATAVPFPVNGTVTGHIGHRYNGGAFDQDDYYQIVTTADGNLNVSLSNTNNQYTYIYLYDNDGTTNLGATSGTAGSGISFTAAGLAAGTYYIRVYGGNAYTGYTLTNTLTPDPLPNDGVANNYFANAPSFAQNDSTYGHIAFRNNGGSYDGDDYFSFYSNGDYDITISLRNDNNNYTYIYLYDTDTSTILGATSGSAQNGISFTTTGLAAGTYYIRVSASGGQYTGYVLKNSYTANPIPADVEPNNTPAQATLVTYNSVNQGHIAYRQTGGGYDNYDYYKFVTPVDGNISISLNNNNNLYTYIYLYDSDGLTQLNATSGSAGSGIGFTSNGLEAGTYYVAVYGGGGQYTGYTLTKTLTPTAFVTDAEPNSDTATAVTFAPNSTLNGHIAHYLNGGGYDTDDFYRIETGQDGNLSVSLSNDNNNYTYIYLVDAISGGILASTSGSAGSGIGISRNGLAAGTYYVRVFGSGGQYAGYALSNTFTVAPYNNDVESNNSFATASILNNNPSKQGHIGYRYNGGAMDNDDFWKITLNSTDSLRLEIQMASNNYSYVYLYDGAQNQIYATSGNNAAYSLFWNSLPAGDYYFRVYAGEYNSYRVTNFYYPCNPSASAITAGGPTTFCAGLNVALNSVGAYNNYQWSTGATTGSITATSTGDYTLTAFDFDGCPHVSNTIHVTVNPAPTPTIVPAGPTTFCNGGNVTLNTQVYSSYLWSTGSTAASINVTPSVPTSYTVTVYNANGCSGTSAPQSVNVNANPSTPVITPSGSLSFCSNTSINLTSTAATSYLWSTGATSQSINVNTAGTFTVTVYNANGCSATSAPVSTTPQTVQTYYRDFDNDTYGNLSNTTQACSAPAGYVSNSTDCNDNNNAIHPGATELCNGVDDDCDSQTDEGCAVFTFFRDFDTDGYGDLNNTTTSVINTPPTGYVSNSTDCNDNNAAIHPGATEVCNSVDDDCDGSIDEGVTTTYYADADADGYGNPNSTIQACSVPALFTTNNLDCNDLNAAIHPGATEIVADGIDQDCSGGDVCYTDLDNDDYGTGVIISSADLDCADANEASVSGDCNDNNAAIHPLATELCNGFDDDCDGTSDEGCGGCVNPPTVEAGMNQSICNGDNASLNATTGGSTTSITWSSPTGGSFVPNVNSAVATYIPTATDNSNGFVRLYITTNAPGTCAAAVDSVDITIVNLLATPGTISGSQYICNPSSGSTFTYSVATVPGATGYIWTAAPNATIISGQGTNSIVVKFTQSAVHNGISASICVSATGPGTCGTSAPSCLPVSVQLVAPVTPGSISGPNKVCPGDTAIYSISYVSRAAFYTWTVPANASVVEGQGTLTVKVAYNASYSGGGEVAVTAGNGCGNSPARTRVILFNALPAPTSISGQASGLCNEQNVMYSAASVPGATSYLWTVPATATIDGAANGSSIMVDYGALTSGNVTVAAVNGCGAGAVRSLAVTGAPATAGPISGNTLVCTGSTNVYQVATVTGATTYNWTVPSGTTIMSGAGTKIINLKFSSTPAYNMVVSVRTGNACGTSALRSLSSIASQFCIRDMENASAINVSPNPSSGIFNIDMSELPAAKTQIIITDISGRNVYNETIANEGKYSVDITSLPDGMYMLQVIADDMIKNVRILKD